MHYKPWFLAALLLLMSVLPAFAMAEAGESIDLTAYDPPLPMDASWELGDQEGEPDPTLPQGYAVADLWQGDRLYFALYRNDGSGGTEIPFLIDVNRDDADNLNYVSRSYAQSGEKYLYFMMIDGETSHGLLYRYDMAANSLEMILGAPCSSNMVLLGGAVDDMEGLGLLLHGDAVVAVDLKTGDVVKTVSIAELGGLPEIGGSFFGGALREGERKYAYLEKNDGGLILINTVVLQWKPVSDIRKCQYAYDPEQSRIVGTMETQGEF